VAQHLFIEFLKDRLKEPLPGIEAQLKMAPRPIAEAPPRKLEAPSNATVSSVLILMFPGDGEDLEVILTLRHKNLNHGGQISFPGGRSEEGETPTQTALRETFEETGIPAESIQVLGELSKLYVSHSNNFVTPVVGYAQSSPKLNLNPAEVEEAFTLKLDSLASKKNLSEENWNLKKHAYKVPFWDVHRVPLWGATAMILSEFLELYREFKSHVSNDKQ
jgi:8-oxo-dGTP pyrophosphatase MutT (NUDIX family)